jgi:hypothetical protein
MPEESKNKPTKVFRCGPVRAAVWTNQRIIDDAVVEVHSIRIDKSYKEGDEWRKTTAFTAEDLPKVAMLTTEAYRFLRLRSEEPSVTLEGQVAADDPTDDGWNRPAAGSVRQPT